MNVRYERGQATAEYSVGTIGAVFMAFWLWRIGTSLGSENPIGNLIHKALEHADDVLRSLGGQDWAWRWFL